MSYFANAGAILVEVFFGLAVGLFVVRVLLQMVRANFYNPVCQFFYKATNPVLVPLRKLLPPWRGFDLAGTLVAYLLECLKVVLLFALKGALPGFGGVLLLGLAELVGFVLMFYFWMILARVVLSFVAQGGYSPVVPLVTQLTEPLLKPVRRRLPDLGGFDLSPMLVMLAIFLARALIVAPLFDLGRAM